MATALRSFGLLGENRDSDLFSSAVEKLATLPKKVAVPVFPRPHFARLVSTGIYGVSEGIL